jgi:hypothetical protein
MTKFTKEQLIEQAQKNISVLRGAVDKVPGGSEAAVIHLRLAEIALAVLTEQPVGFYRASRHGDGYYLANNMEQTTGTIPLYRLPLLEGFK